MVNQLKRLLRFTPLVLALILLLGSSTPAHAEGCFVRFIDCVQRAANETSYWRSVAATGDCEVDMAGCVRRELLGR
jgi:hypothetical protein